MKPLTDDLLVDKTKKEVKTERKTINEVLRHLSEIESRSLYLGRGYSSLFEFCVEELRYDGASAQRRISAMRLLKEAGAIEQATLEEKLENGLLHLSQLALAQRVFKKLRIKENKPRPVSDKLKLLKEFEGCSYRDCEKLASILLDEPLKKSVSLDIEAIELLERFKALTAHKNPWADSNEAIKLALKTAIAQVDPNLNPPKKVGFYSKPDARVPGKALKHAIWSRYDGGCAFVDPKTGKRCGSHFRLEFDHKIPFSRGGKTTFQNLQLLCRAHNQAKKDLLPH